MSKGRGANDLASSYREATEFAGLGFYAYAIDGTLLFADRGTLRIIELDERYPDPAEVAGKHMLELVEYLEPPGRLRDEVLRRGHVHGEEYRFKTLRGTEKWVVHDSRLVRDPETGAESVHVVVRDITDHKRIEQALRVSEQRYRALFETMLDSFALCVAVPGPDGRPEDFRFAEVNPAFEALIGRGADDIVGRTMRGDSVAEDLGVFDTFVRVVATGESQRGEHYSRRLDKHLEGIVYRPQRGHVAAIFADVTDRRHLEAQLRQAAKMEAIGTLAGGVAHEINNPVNIIMNYGELIAREVGHESRAAEFAREIIAESQRIAEIVRSLLAFARSERETYSQARLSDIVDGAVVLVKKVLSKDQIAIEVDVPEGLPEVLCRTQQIQQVVMNLVTNARDALNARFEGYHEDKKVTITARAVSVDGQPHVRVTVEDRGTGIAPEALERVFDPFFTTKPTGAGTGLGLSVSHGIVDDHGGRLWVESEVGRWTRFQMDLAALPFLPPSEGAGRRGQGDR